MALRAAAAPHHPNLTIAEARQNAAVLAAAAAAAAARAAAAAARAAAAAARADQSPQSPPKMAPPPLAAASGKQNGPRGRGSVSTELPAEGPAEEEEQDPRHSRRSLRSQSPGDDADRVARSRAVAYAGAAQGAAAAAHAAAATAAHASQGPGNLPGDEKEKTAEEAGLAVPAVSSGPCGLQRALRSPERPPRQLKRKRPTASAPSEAPDPHIVAKWARTCASSWTATKENDWTCRQCGNKNWYKRCYCIGGNNKCLTPRDRNWTPGDWYCECGNHNLSRRTVCNRDNCQLTRAQGEKARF